MFLGSVVLAIVVSGFPPETPAAAAEDLVCREASFAARMPGHKGHCEGLVSASELRSYVAAAVRFSKPGVEPKPLAGLRLRASVRSTRLFVTKFKA